MTAVYKLDKNFFDIAETADGLVFTPSTERKTYSQHVMSVCQLIHDLPGAKDGRVPSQRVLLARARQLHTYVCQLSTHLGVHNEHRLKSLLDKKVGYLAYLKQAHYSFEDL